MGAKIVLSFIYHRFLAKKDVFQRFCSVESEALFSPFRGSVYSIQRLCFESVLNDRYEYLIHLSV